MNRDVLVVGGGIAGMQAALLLAEKDHRVHLLDSAPAIGGFFPLLDRQFPTNSCGVCFMSPKPPAYCPIHETDFRENIDLLTNCEVQGLKGQAGAFEVSYLQRPRCVDVDKCTLCGKCAEVCPVEVEKEFGSGIRKRKAIYTPIGTAIPRSYTVDAQACTKCGKCVEVCAPGAIDLDEKPAEAKLKVGAVVLGFGFEPFRAGLKGEYGHGRYPNVVSSIQYERMLSLGSAAEGLPVRFSDSKRPRKVAFIQCVGSRDISCGQGYCSTICCMYATKQAMVTKGRDESVDAAVFYMDIRPMGKDYERYYERAKKEYGVRYVRSAVSTVRELKRSNRLLLEYGLESGEVKAEEFDMVVLSLGFTPPEGVKEIAERLGVELNEFGFCKTEELRPTQTSVPGVFVAGAFSEPRDIPETVVQACSAASDVSVLLDDFEESPGGEEAPEAEKLSEEEEARVGVFICDRKGVLSEGLDVEKIINGIREEQGVEAVELVDVTVLQKGIDAIKAMVADGNFNRALVAGRRGLALVNSLKEQCEAFTSGAVHLECVPISEGCVGGHTERSVLDPAQATARVERLVRAGLRKSVRATPRKRGSKKVSSRVLVVGGGVAGLSAGLDLAEQGMEVTLIEKETELGGSAREAFYTLGGADVQALVRDLVTRAEGHAKIEVLKGAELKSQEGTWGTFRSVVSLGDEDREVLHGAVIFATGGREAQPDEYLLGKNPNVVTQRKFETMLAAGDAEATGARTVVMIQCVGSRDQERPYCSKTCCRDAVKNAIKLKEVNPGAEVFVLCRDVRTYGFSEKYYREARDKGVVFVRYEPEAKPRVAGAAGGLKVSFNDAMAGAGIDLDADLLVLSTGVEPGDVRGLAEMAGLELNADGFFAEANPKAAPLDAVDRGKFFVGLCNSPVGMEEAICQGKAAAARASALLWSGVVEFAEDIACVQERLCSGCGLCVSACPFGARVIDETSNKAVVIEDLCKGCGTCVISCPNGASQQQNYERATVMDVLNEVMA